MLFFKNRHQINLLTLSNEGGLLCEFFPSGSVFSIKASDIMVNQVLGNPFDGNMNNIYLRLKDSSGQRSFPLLGPEACPSASQSDNKIEWNGKVADGISYCCQLVLDEKEMAWNWNVSILNESSVSYTVDLIAVQDIAISTEDVVRRSEAYCSQYIDHFVFSDETNGYTVACRQNQKMSQGYPWFVSGCLEKISAYSTDAMDFYGLSYKKTFVPEALTRDNLISQKSQYESACVALQTENKTLKSAQSLDVHFFYHFLMDHPKETRPEDKKTVDSFRVRAKKRILKMSSSQKKISSASSIFKNPSGTTFFNGEDLSADEQMTLFHGEHRHKESSGGKILSFFYEQDNYVVLKDKEILCERPHGHILRSGDDLFSNNENILSSTNAMYGLFHSHVSVGNTSFNKFLTVARSPLNFFSSMGQRVFMKVDGMWKRLNLPSAYEVSRSFSRWIYKYKGEIISVRAWASSNEPHCYLNISSEQEHEFLISHNVLMGTNDWDDNIPFAISQKDYHVRLFVPSDSFLEAHYPEAEFRIEALSVTDVQSISTDSSLQESSSVCNLPYVVFETKATCDFSIRMSACLFAENKNKTLHSNNKLSKEGDLFHKDIENSTKFWNQTLLKDCSFSMSKNHEQSSNISKLNDIVKWYAHNAMIHYSVPYGLEQFSGAAWGVRDVCQGPIEFFLSFGHMDVAKDILRVVFQKQFFLSGDWPQWFMFDRYKEIQASESHGDIILWPMKALSSYIRASGDIDFLREVVPFTDHKNFDLVHHAPLLDHIRKAVDSIKQNFISSTSLSSYGGGDWDDTLQPSDEKLRSSMVSAWTVALTYQVFQELIPALELSGEKAFVEELQLLSEKIKEDFNSFLIKDSVVSGFINMKEKREKLDYIIHPSTEKVGPKYRLLPMIRGIISGIFDLEQAQTHLEVIQNHLNFPDGVHLMDKPITYRGGVRCYFRRAEEASYFGREVGTQYIHAHIRYIEAMCQMGLASKAYEALLKIIPINIQDSVPLANIRQSNAYFSSSDGDFSDRYEAQTHFLNLKKGLVGFKSGWRIYSSGPGILICQIMQNFCGIRCSYGNILIDPVFPVELDGMILTINLFDVNISFCFHVKTEKVSKKVIVINDTEISSVSFLNNPYRLGAICVSQKIFREHLSSHNNRVDVYLLD